MPPLVSLNQISCSCPAGLNLSLAGSCIPSCSSTDLKRNAVFRLWSVLWQRDPAVTLLNIDRLGGRGRPVTHTRHRTQGSSSELRPADQEPPPFFDFSCPELTGGSSAWGVHRAALTPHDPPPSVYSPLTTQSLPRLTGQLICTRPCKGAKVTEMRPTLSLSGDSASGGGRCWPRAGTDGSAWRSRGGLVGREALERALKG